MRVRCFTQDDAHIFMTPEQIKDEIKGVVALINDTYSMFGFKYHVELSTRPEDSIDVYKRQSLYHKTKKIANPLYKSQVPGPY